MTVGQHTSVETHVRPRGNDLRLALATSRIFLLRYASNPIMLIRAPLSPVAILIGYHLAYEVSGQQQVGNASAMGFLVIGMLGMGAWNSTVWGCGNAIESEVFEGTISSVIAAPGRISAVIAGHGIGSIVFGLPALVMSILVGLAFGAHFDVAHPTAALVSLLAVYVSCLCVGLAFGGLFVLSRQSNALSNFLQAPIYLLAGLFIPRSALPEWLQKVSDVLPLSHAIDALRATALSGASLSDEGASLVAVLGTSVGFLAVGLWGLHRLDVVVRRHGTLDLM